MFNWALFSEFSIRILGTIVGLIIVAIPIYAICKITKNKEWKDKKKENDIQSHGSNVLEFEEYKPSKKEAPARKTITFEDLSEDIFAISMDLSDSYQMALSRKMGVSENEPFVVLSSADAATALYEYAVLLLRKRLHLICADKNSFESKDNDMIDAFAKRMAMPPLALHKIITQHNKESDWEDILSKLPAEAKSDQYIGKVKKAISKYN